MKNKLLVIDGVSLEKRHLESRAPHLSRLAREGFSAELIPTFPAVTCSVQSSMLTGRPPADHGIVGNGWYFRDLAEVWLWRQSNHLVQGEKIWERLRKRHEGFTVAKLFWWYNMYSTADWSVTVRPHYPCDGRKIPGIYTQPSSLEKRLESRLGRFPLFHFWGPTAGIISTRWIVDCTVEVLRDCGPDLALVYLPHVDYDFQRFGPHSRQAGGAVEELDREAGRLIAFARSRGYEILFVSEYAMTEVTDAVMINAILRRGGYLKVRESLVGELLDCGASRAFAVADHQVAHVYIRDPSDVEPVRLLLEAADGVAEVLDAGGKRRRGVDHERSGELVALSAPDRWFAYPWWLEPDRAPDFARTVDIHRKPGYDPVELFFDPAKPLPGLRAAWKLLLKTLGFRTVFNLISLDTSLVRGSHGLVLEEGGPLPLIVGSKNSLRQDRVHASEVFGLIERFFDGE